MNGKCPKGKGTCGICWNQFKTHSSDGAIHRQRLRSLPCPGSSQPPVENVVSCAFLSPSSSSSEGITDSENNTSALTQPDSDIQQNLNHPSNDPLASGRKRRTRKRNSSIDKSIDDYCTDETKPLFDTSPLRSYSATQAHTKSGQTRPQ